MKSMTIHGIDKQLETLIRAKAEADGTSLNKTIKKLLESALGIRPAPARKNLEEFTEFCGLWDADDLQQFEETTEDFRAIDEKDWR